MRRFDGTIAYQDALPEPVRTEILQDHPGFTIDDILYVNDRGFRGYLVELEQEDVEINLKVALDGEILESVREMD